MNSHWLAKNGTILLDFPVQRTYVKDEAGVDQVEKAVLTALERDFGQFTRLIHHQMRGVHDTKDFLRVFADCIYGYTLTLRTFEHHCLVTATLEYDKTRRMNDISYDRIKEIEKDMIKSLNTAKKTKAVPELKRGLKHDIYFNTSDDRLLEYDVREMLFDKQSEFQHVQIARSLNYGNMLILDGLLNLSDSDILYTESLMLTPQFNYKDKNILILGGGDGALLHELLKQNPRHVTMIEIDDVVMQACKKYLRFSCGTVLDNYEQEKYKIVVGDCVKFLNNCIETGQQFDVIFGDLTDVPISSTPRGELWEFLKNTVRLSFKILKKDGVYMTHGNGASSAASLLMFETTVKDIVGNQLRLERSENFIPSFMERWVFYQLYNDPPC